MEQLNAKLVSTVAAHMNGARRAKFLASVQILNTSLAQGGWTPRGSVKANAGFYQGLSSKRRDHANFAISMCLSYGSLKYRGGVTPEVLAAAELSPVELAWVALCQEVDAARKALDDARPLPKVTAIGLSPKVTKTFQECNLDLDITTIKLAKIDFIMVQSRHPKTFELLFDKQGEPVMERQYFVAWTPGILHGQSRFAWHCGYDCEACGKTIPSNRFVPIEVHCRKLGKLISLNVGCDCSKNIFGIQDVGVSRRVEGT